MTWARLWALLAVGALLVVAASGSVVGVDSAVSTVASPSAAVIPDYGQPSANRPDTQQERHDGGTSVLSTSAPAPSASAVPLPGPGPDNKVSPETDTAQAPVPSSHFAVGALFSGAEHYCSASVVHSPAGDLVLTAAHCVHDGAGGGYYTDMVFEPGYHDGVAPFGKWAVTQSFVAPGWAATSDPDLDFAFLTVHQDGNPDSLESLTGADELGLDFGFTNDVTLTGYPDDGEVPVTCENTTTQQDFYQLQMACTGFPQGTSGGPWIVDADPTTHLGKVIGVIGGYESGGDNDVSYSSYFDTDIAALYKTSTSA
jgi:V8-like Glu-specific endopeptidase